ncbi:anthrone oxygenase family protein [Streptomyces sp. NPDC019396]|uniref:anthrone oxygenase family protein n=1 Tax=Streptomyces sp. NPDC019396 TaxID=3154687 RepID=UPI0033EEC76F
MASSLLALAVISTGLYAGFLLIFQTGIMPALAKLSDDQFVPAMRRINEEVPRAVFMVVFLAIIVFPVAALVVPAEGRSAAQTWLLVAGVVCASLNHLITITGNIPLNNALASSGSSPDSAVRAAFEAKWNRFHTVRTGLSLASFVLIVWGSLV